MPFVSFLVQLGAPTPALLQIDGARRSLLADGTSQLLAVLLRESGF